MTRILATYLLDDVVVNTMMDEVYHQFFFNQTVKQLGVIWKVVLSEVYKLNDLGR